MSGTGIFPGERDRTGGYNARVSGQTGTILKRRAYVSKHAARYRKAASAHAAALKAAAQTNDSQSFVDSVFGRFGVNTPKPDGAYLGQLTDNPYLPDSITNPYGP